MEGFTTNYNVVVKRLCYWHYVLEHLLQLEHLVLSNEDLSREDRRVLRKIRKALSDSFKITQKQRNYYGRQLEKQRKEYVNEG